MKIMEGYFVMSMFVDVSDSSMSMEKVRERLDSLEKEMGLKIQIQHEKVFNAMHRP
jgi:ACT domain-containing protein